MKKNNLIYIYIYISIILLPSLISTLENKVANILSAIFAFVILILLIIHSVKSTKEAEIETEKKEIEERKLIEKIVYKLCRNGNYRYVENFARKYENNYSEEDLDKLRVLIEKSTNFVKLPTEIVETIVHAELNTQQYKQFKKKVMYNKPQTEKECIINFLEYFNDDIAIEYTLFPNKDIGIIPKEETLHLPISGKITWLGDLLKEKFNIEQDIDLLLNKLRTTKEALELSNFERSLSSASERNISIDDLDTMTGFDFEYFLKDLFQKMGYKTEHTKLSGDQGADLVVSKFGEKIAIQAKRTDSVNNKAVQEVVASLKHYSADRGMVITTGRFTKSAINLANSNNIELIDRHKLAQLIKKWL